MSRTAPFTIELPDFVLDCLEDAVRADIAYLELHHEPGEAREAALAKRQDTAVILTVALMGLAQGANVGGSLAQALSAREATVAAHRHAFQGDTHE